MNKQGVTCLLGSEGKYGPELHSHDDIRDNGYPRNAVPAQFYLCYDSRYEFCPYALSINVKAEGLSFKKTFCLYGMRQNKSV